MEKTPRALVTGAARRVGREISLTLARKGYQIAAHYHRSETEVATLVDEIISSGGSATPFGADLSEPGGAESLAERVLEFSGPVDLLVNNASLWKPTSLNDLTADEFDRMLAINLRSPFLLALDLGRAMKKCGSGQIINILDWSVGRPYANFLAYGIAKAGLAEATRGLARALAPEVRVNGIAPGAVLLPEETDSEQERAILRAVPLGRIGTPGDVAAAVLYLAEADYATGSILTVDGGRSVR